MYTTTHLALGLIIGKLTGDYPAAILGSLIIDIDHLIPAAKEGRLFNVKELWKRSRVPEGGGRSYFHGIIPWALISVVICLIDLRFGLVFTLAYLGHLIFDALDNSDFWPLYPFNRKINIKGFVPYYSRQELIFSIMLFLAYFMIY